MKALNRKASATSLSMNDHQSQSQQQYQQQYGGKDRGSVPPGGLESRSLSKNAKSATLSGKADTNQRAKSVTKEPLHREDSQKSNDSGSSIINSGASRFFTLTRRIGDKIRFRTSSQPPAPLQSTLGGLNHNDDGSDYNLSDMSEIRNNKISTKSQSSQFLSPPPDIEVQAADEDVISKQSSNKQRDRAMSPAKFLSSLRARSPFGKSNRNSRASSATPSAVSVPANALANTTTISSKNKGFTISLNNQQGDQIVMSNAQATSTPRNQLLTSTLYQSTSINSNNSYNNEMNDSNNLNSTYSPSMTANKILNRFIRSNTNERNGLAATAAAAAAAQNSRSISCDFADNGSIGSASSAKPSPVLNSTNNSQLKQLNEANDEFEDAYGGDNQSGNSATYSTQPKLSGVSKNVGSKVEMLRKSFMESQNNSVEVVKSVKFKDMPAEGGSNSAAAKPSSLSSNNLADKSLGKPPLMNVFTPNVTNGGSSNNTSGTNSVTGTPNSRAKFLGIRARTIDFPDLLQNTVENNNSAAETGSKGMLSPTTASSRPIQSILRRSETPPNIKGNLRQQLSVESSDSNMDRLLRSTTSTSRPLMFNGNS
jgi:hypothetical protein